MSSDLTPEEVRQTDLAYYAVLEPPPFALGGHWVELQSAMYAHLRRFKLRLSDIKSREYHRESRRPFDRLLDGKCGV